MKIYSDVKLDTDTPNDELLSFEDDYDDGCVSEKIEEDEKVADDLEEIVE